MWSNRSSAYASAAAQLIAGVVGDPWGQVEPAWYDTAPASGGQPVAGGHRARIRFLLDEQRADGGWGEPDGYALVPTLSSTGALLTEAARTGSAIEAAPLVTAARRGLVMLRRGLTAPATQVPDTIGVELILPALVAEVSALVQGVLAEPPLTLPDGFDMATVDRCRRLLVTGELPQRTWACLEVLGPEVRHAPGIRPTGGAVACSVAATAAWLGEVPKSAEALMFLDRLQARGRGPVPAVAPITYFEPAWVLNSLALSGISYRASAALLDRLEAGLTAAGAPAAPGLPADADDTAAVLSALLRHGRFHSPQPLLTFLSGDRFVCFPGERTPSVSTNAHVLEALALYRRHDPAYAGPLGAAASTAASWLCGQQRPDGSWLDKWHASPFYATFCVLVGLMLHDRDGHAREIQQAVDWLLATQRSDGSWGRWHGTVEETSYAMQALVLAGGDVSEAAAVRAAGFLTAPAAGARHAPLWHAKDLYAPTTVIRAAALAAQAMADRIAQPVPRRGGSDWDCAAGAPRPRTPMAQAASVVAAAGHA